MSTSTSEAEARVGEPGAWLCLPDVACELSGV